MIVIGQMHEHATPRAPTSDNVLMSIFAPSGRKRNGSAPATVVPVVDKSAVIFFLNARYMHNAELSFLSFIRDLTPSTHRIAALTVIPLTAIKAQAIAELYALPDNARHNAGIARDAGTAERTSRGIVKDSLMAAMIM